MANFIHCNFLSQRRTRLCQVGRLFHGNWQQSDFINPHFTALLIQPLSVWIWFLETRHWGHDILCNREKPQKCTSGASEELWVCVSPRRKNLVRGKRWVRSNLLDQAAVSLTSTQSGRARWGTSWATVLWWEEKRGVEKPIFFLILEGTSSLHQSLPPPHGCGSFLVPTWSDWCCHGAIEIVKRWMAQVYQRVANHPRFQCRATFRYIFVYSAGRGAGPRNH